MHHELTDHFIVAADAQETWRFFSSANNLPAITPPWLGFKIRTPQPIVLQNDSTLDYTIRWLKLPIRWRTKIVEWTPPHRFMDLQIRGPYALWLHEHTFTPSDRGTVCTDKVLYRVPGPVIGDIMNAAVVRKQLFEIFRYRRQVIGERLGWVAAVQDDVRIRPLG